MLGRVICGIGCLITLYLLYLYDYVGICMGHCDPLNYSLGLAWFFAGMLIDKRFVKLWSIIGISGILYFVARETVEGFCLYCTLLHVIGIASILAFEIKKFRHPKELRATL